MDEQELKKLNENIEKLSDIIERQVSFRFILLKGILYGVASVIGATIVAGIVFMLLDRFLDRAEVIPVVDTVVNEIEESRPNNLP